MIICRLISEEVSAGAISLSYLTDLHSHHSLSDLVCLVDEQTKVEEGVIESQWLPAVSDDINH